MFKNVSILPGRNWWKKGTVPEHLTQAETRELNEADEKFSALCEEKIVTYDVTKYPFRDIVSRCLQQTNLEKLHETPDITSMRV